MKQEFWETLNNYLLIKNQPLKGNALATAFRQGIPVKIKLEAAIADNYRIRGSVGAGQWAQIPWIVVFDKQITTSAERGYYVCYLFRSDMSGVYLSLNMGWTQFGKKFKPLKRAKEKIKETAYICKVLLRSSLSDFSYEPIDLVTKERLGTGYELGHICGKFYTKDNIPEDNILVDDLRNLLGVYRELKGLVKTSDITNLPVKYGEQQLELEDLENIQYQREVEKATPIYIPPGPQEKPKKTVVKGQEKWPTNPKIAKDCIIKSRYNCEVNSGHKTFTSKVTGHNYVEAHHLVPMKFQDNFPHRLDVPANIIVLCPNCHQLLHHAEKGEKTAILIALLDDRRSRLEEADIHISQDKLSGLY